VGSWGGGAIVSTVIESSTVPIYNTTVVFWNTTA
jgi:hypothetical protein